MTFDIVHSISIETTPERLYETITTQNGLAEWWTPETKAEPIVGAINEFHFMGTTLKFRVDKLEPARHVVWSSVLVPPSWEKTHVLFDITPEGDTVNLKFSHTGFTSPGGDFGITSYSWAQYIRSIKLLLETGEGEPFGSMGSLLAGTTPR
ncbi:MAG TPA: SRPBCC domain-containing protein [Ktedonobacteraceae bacterium]|nr:SRPBCC domain-containing protein [Ktedonobacteraceae bacterium]